MGENPKDQFLSELRRSFRESAFVKFTLSKPTKRDGEALPQNIYGRLVELKKGLALSCTLRYPDNDVTQNYLLGDELNAQLEIWLGNEFLIVTLLTIDEDIVLKYNKKRVPHLLRTKVKARKAVVIGAHNKEKNYAIAEESRFLELLGLSSSAGKVMKGNEDKYRQINKYIEIMHALIEQCGLLSSKPEPISIVDMGSGKGYLSFALYDLLVNQLHLKTSLLGVELREPLTRFCNEQAKLLGWQEGLRFAAMDILDYNDGNIDILIALHACDIATDIAIAQGIKNEAALIVTAPCCHKQIRKAIHPQGVWKSILKHGILLERQAELVTDAIRSLLLEAAGYKTKVFEFISTEHTAKNVMITAVKAPEAISDTEKEGLLAEVAALKLAFGIETHYLETLLAF